MSRIIVCGGRDYRNMSYVFQVLNALGPLEIAHGACGWDADKAETNFQAFLCGADRCADLWARDRQRSVNIWPAHWSTLKRRAGPIRNRKMLDEFVPDYVLAFPGGAGTDDMCNYAIDKGVPVLRADPVRTVHEARRGGICR